ncbi:MAG: ornithine cyclodeaminase family protein [Reichenbachiella sp.]|uniref:ornithine cyclodeaminase family protein n=1 Tax=Reichenbachiella sp. TaxID=2184521 RepID=UPI0029677166|nr:ornithine cyclodeaminase family protein [Reichenbachiella sp.]MDW3208276.1 ornithine cyclodeaminase family protein [Reichenbachiella sp.]
MKYIEAEELEQLLSYEELIPKINEAFAQNYNIPMRHHHQYPNPKEGMESTLLLMPAWDNGENLGVKIVNVSPNNSKHNLPSIQGLYIYFDLQTGTPKALMDAKKLTVKRTAAASALASQYLSRANSQTLLVIGTGALSAELIHAHCAVRPITEVLVWGRSEDKAQTVVDSVNIDGVSIKTIGTIEQGMAQADIISCATLSPTALVFGKNLKPGQHLDMIGAYKPDMREMDDEVLAMADIYVDNLEGATKETGDLAIPIANGTFKIEDIKADLFELAQGKKEVIRTPENITCFKSVGHALEDLAAATLAFDKSQKQLTDV